MNGTNPLEEALKKAATDPEARPIFYQTLMRSLIYVVGRPEQGENGQSSGHVQLKQWQQPDGTLALPFFATPASLRQTLGEEEPFLEMPALDLFRLAKNVTLVLTAEGASKAFKADEVQALLSSALAMDPLAQALVQAVKENTEPARRNFYQVLINSQVYVIGQPANVELQNEQGARQMTENDQFNFSAVAHPHKEGEKILPFFSSLDHLRRVLPKEGRYLGFPALVFFGLARPLGIPLALNLGSEPHKFFTNEELDFLLQSTIQEPFEARSFPPGSKIFLSPPEKYPQELVRALLDFLPEFPEVRTAYLAMMREKSEDAEPVMVIGFEADGDLTPMFRAAGPVVNEHAEEGLAVDFARITPGERGLSQYFIDKVSPFYRRAFKDELRQTEPTPPPPKKGGDAKEQYDEPGFFGRLKRIFGGSK